MSDVLSHTLQENLLVLLCFDDDSAPKIRQLVTPELFSPQYRPVVREIFQFHDDYREAPKLHTDELFEEAWTDKSDADRENMSEILEGMRSLRESINPDWAMARLEAFVHTQTLRTSIMDAAELLQSQQPTMDQVSQAYDIIRDASRGPATTTDLGSRLSGATPAIYERNTEEVLRTGIGPIDWYDNGPAKRRLHLFLAETKFGKSWWLAYLMKKAALQRWNSVLITMENSEEETHMRLISAFFGIAKRADQFGVYRMLRDDDDRLIDMEWERMVPEHHAQQPDFRDKLGEKIKRAKRILDRIHVKFFPSKTMTCARLDSYLDMLESQEGFVPDLCCVDYPELFHFRAEYQRQEIGAIYANLKRIADERRLAMATVSQINREGASAKSARATHAAEDWSKIHHSDSVLVASQTEKEKSMNLARLFMDRSRTDVGQYTVLISQALGIGQFCLDSAMMNHQAAQLLKEHTRLANADVDDEADYDELDED